MDEFERLLNAERAPIERFVRYKIGSESDAEDVLQEVYLSASQRFSQLKNHEAFRYWMISIAKNKCNDYFRKKAANPEVSIDELKEIELYDGRHGIVNTNTVRDVFDLLDDKDKQILYLYFWQEIPQTEIAKKLKIPVGTVKSRLYKAKKNFKSKYPYRTGAMKGDNIMKKLPEFIPEYSIEASREKPFSVKWEELMGWFLVPKLGERLSWGMYDIPSRKCSHIYDMEVTGRAKVHGIEGVELTAREASYSEKTEIIERTFVAQLTDTHCRYLAALRNDDGIRNYITFLDGEEFMRCWGFGEDNCGNETDLSPKGNIKRSGNVVTGVQKDFLLDVVGRYTVTIGGKSYDTVCVMDIECYNCGVVSEQFLDKNGRTVLWRRFNRDDWAIDHYKKKWSELLPDNERIIVNGVTYVQWYDCITDYIL